MSVSIKVAVRCRPFTIDDDLGVNLTQSGEEEGEASQVYMFSKICVEMSIFWIVWILHVKIWRRLANEEDNAVPWTGCVLPNRAANKRVRPVVIVLVPSSSPFPSDSDRHPQLSLLNDEVRLHIRLVVSIWLLPPCQE